MISRFLFRFKTWLIVFVFLTINISVPNNSETEESAVNQTILAQSDATAVADNEEFTFELDCLLEMIIEEGLAFYNLFPDGDWSTDNPTIPVITEFDVITHSTYLPPLVPPKVKRLLARNMTLPESRIPDTPTMPPEMNT